MPCDYRNYPANWKKEIVPRILERDGNKCIACGLAKNIWGYYNQADQFIQLDPASTAADVAREDGFKVLQVQIGVAHLDHGLTDHSDENLGSLCRRCHIRYDAPVSAPKAAATRKYGRYQDRKMKSLFDPPEDATSLHL